MLTAFLILLLLITTFGFFQFRNLSNAYKFLTVYILFVGLIELVGIYLKGKIHTNFPSMNVFTFIGVVFNGLIYFQVLRNKKFARQIVIRFTTFCILSLALNLIYFQNLYEFPSNGMVIIVFQVVVFVFLTYVKLLNQSRKGPIYMQSDFWLNSGNFLFYGITLFIFAFFKYVNQDENSTWIYSLIKYANFVMYIFFFIAINIDRKEVDEC